MENYCVIVIFELHILTINTDQCEDNDHVYELSIIIDNNLNLLD